MPFQVDCVVKGTDKLGESPIWCDREQVLWWVDSRGPTLKRWDPASGKVRELQLPAVVGSVAFREKGGMLAALQTGIHFLDTQSGALQTVAQPEAHLPGNRFNDGRCDRAGRFWSGTMSDVKREPTGSLYRISADLVCTHMRSDIIVPNSLAWSPDNRTMYFGDTPRMRIWAFDYDLASGAMSNERVFAETCAAFLLERRDWDRLWLWNIPEQSQVLPHLQENDLVITLGAGTITTLSDKIVEALLKQ